LYHTAVKGATPPGCVVKQIAIENPTRNSPFRERDAEKEARISTTKTLRVPAVNKTGPWSWWAFVEAGDL
jgi:hypothetical protein